MFFCSHAVRAAEWHEAPLAHGWSFEKRCNLVREIFSPRAFAELSDFAHARCIDRTADGAAIIEAMAAFPKGKEVESLPLFSAGEQCSGLGFIVLSPAVLEAPMVPRNMLRLSLAPPRSDTIEMTLYVFGFPPPRGEGGLLLCGAVGAKATYRHGAWTLSPTKRRKKCTSSSR